MKSVMQKLYEYAPSVELGRSVFNRNHAHKTTFRAGELIPILVDEVLPGDTFKLDVTALVRLTTPIVPVMDNLHVDTEYFFVPMRLVWENAQRFFGERDPDPDSSIDYTLPQLTIDGGANIIAAETLGDYMGIPPGITPNTLPTSLPMRCYNKIFNDWYRDQNVDDSLTVDMDDGPDDLKDYVVQRRRKKHDYFTSCLPWPQKGDEVEMPLGDTAPVYGDGQALGLEDGNTNTFAMFHNNTTGDMDAADDIYSDPMGTATGNTGGMVDNVAIGVTTDGDHSGLIADLSDATASTINALRLAFQLQKFKEKEARSGSRYKEIVYGFFGVDTGDARLQRPEYLGGSSHMMAIRPVSQQSQTDTTPLGTLAGIGLYAGNAGGFYKSFTEHGYLIGIMSVRADLTYQQGIERMWWRSVREDFYWPQFAHIGEQEVYNREIFVQGAAADDTVFGYQERYHEYRMKMSRISGQFRSDFAESLDIWHLSEDFLALPVLTADFLKDETDTVLERILAVTEHGEEDYPQLQADIFFDYSCERPMPTRSVPGYIDHF